MEAKEYIKKYVKDEYVDDFGVLALKENEDGEGWFWWHVHLDEELPDDGEIIVLRCT